MSFGHKGLHFTFTYKFQNSIYFFSTDSFFIRSCGGKPLNDCVNINTTNLKHFIHTNDYRYDYARMHYSPSFLKSNTVNDL